MMDPNQHESNGGTSDRRLKRQYLRVHQGEDEGFYEPTSDAHLYDLMGEPLENPEAPGPTASTDLLVVTAAWSAPPEHLAELNRWLERIRHLPNAWLTPWRDGEPAIPAELWINTPDSLLAGKTGGATDPEGESVPGHLVVRLDNSYRPGAALRSSMDAALERFDDLRKAVELAFEQELSFQPIRATRAWLDALENTDAAIEESVEEELESVIQWESPASDPEKHTTQVQSTPGDEDGSTGFM